MPKKPGRKSVAEAAAPAQTASVKPFAPAPDVLQPEAQALWRSIIGERPHNHFSSADRPLLREYCHTVASLIPRLNELLAESGVDLELLKARDSLVRQAAALARTLRICVSSRTRPDTAAMRDSVQDGPPLWAVR